MGSLAAYYGGWVDTLISRIMEIFAAFPDLIFLQWRLCMY